MAGAAAGWSRMLGTPEHGAGPDLLRGHRASSNLSKEVLPMTPAEGRYGKANGGEHAP